jgi:hypothetical protein
MTTTLSGILSSLVDWEDESKETPTQRALKKKFPKKNPPTKSFWSSPVPSQSSSSIATDLQDLNTLARLRSWAAIEECAAQVDSSHHTTLTKAGNAALHTAISNGAPLSTIQALVIANPPSVAFPNHFGNLPLHFVAWKNKSSEAFAICEFLLAYYPQASRHLNRHGNLPLHHAAFYKAHPDLVQLLWRAYPNAVGIKNDKGLTPLDQAVDRHGDSHSVVKMLQGLTSRNYVYQQYQPSPALYLDIIAQKITRIKDQDDSLRQQQHHQQSQHTHKHSTTQDAVPEIKIDTWHDVEL